MTNQPQDNNTHDAPQPSAAQRSGLFGSQPRQPQPASDKPRTAQPNKQRTAKPRTTIPRKPRAQPATATGSIFSVQKNVFDAIRESIRLEGKSAGNKSLWKISGELGGTIDRYEREIAALNAELAHAREAAQPGGPVRELTVEELIDRLTTSLRDTQATPTDVKTLSQVLRDLKPSLFASVDNAPPDPCAIAEFLCGWAGMTGEQIAQTMGGRDALSKQLSEVLKSCVIVQP